MTVVITQAVIIQKYMGDTMRKKIISVVMMLILAFCMTACGSSPKGDKITSSWKLVEFTMNGETITYTDSTRDDFAPKFSSKDGKTFVFDFNGKRHTGTLEKNGDKYILNYDDTAKQMEATISGDSMTIVIVGSDSMKLVFEAE